MSYNMSRTPEPEITARAKEPYHNKLVSLSIGELSSQERQTHETCHEVSRQSPGIVSADDECSHGRQVKSPPQFRAWESRAFPTQTEVLEVREICRMVRPHPTNWSLCKSSRKAHLVLAEEQCSGNQPFCRIHESDTFQIAS